MTDVGKDTPPLAAPADLPSFKVLVWDLPTRLFHWLLVGCTIVSVGTAKLAGLAMQYHEWCGVAILVLVLFRALWGVVGGRHARFISFVAGPRKVIAYARTLSGGGVERYLGHNPLGGWSILAMLAALGVQVGTGLFANDDIFTEGPLAHWVSKAASDYLTHIHHTNKFILIVLVSLHLAAVAFYHAVKKENLVTPMVTGYKRWPKAGSDTKDHWMRALLMMVIIALAIGWVIYG